MPLVMCGSPYSRTACPPMVMEDAEVVGFLPHGHKKFQCLLMG